MKILIVTSSYPPVLGGLQIVCEHIAHGLEARNNQVRVLTNRVPMNLPSSEKKGCISIYRWWFPDLVWIRPVSFKSLLVQLWKYVVYPITMLRLGTLLFLYRPEVVNLHHPQSMMGYFLFWKRLISFKLLTSIHGYDLECFVKPEKRKSEQFELKANCVNLSLMRKWLRQSDWIICNSQYMANLATWLVPEENLTQRITVIPNAIDPDRFRIDSVILNRRIEPFIFSYGRFDKGKGMDILISAFAIIKNHIKLKLVIAGEGPDRKLLEDMINNSGVANRVILLGRITQEEVVYHLNNADFVVIPSRSEAFGITALEALAAGKPLLATNVGGIPELIKQTVTGHLCEPDADSMAQGLLRMSSGTYDEDDVKRQQSKIWNNFNWSAYMMHYMRVIEFVISSIIFILIVQNIH